MAMFTMTKKQLKVDGVTVAHITSDRAFQTLIRALMESIPTTQAVYLALSYLGEARTNDIAKFLGVNYNIGRLLDDLADDGVVEVVDDAQTNGKAGRPSRVWAVAK